MSLAVPGVVQGRIRIQGRNRLVIVHWVRMITHSQLAEFLAEEALAAFQNLPAFSLPVSVFDPSSFYPAFFTAIFLREPAEKLTVADEACFEHFLVGLDQYGFPLRYWAVCLFTPILPGH